MKRSTFLHLGSAALAASISNPLKLISAAPQTPDAHTSWSKLRRDFPLSRKIAYLNNGTMGPSPQCVIDAEQKAMNRINKDAIYGGNETELLQAWARFLGADVDEIALTQNVTHGINIMAAGIEATRGDEVILTGHEHVGNALPWLHQLKLRGIQPKLMLLGSNAEETLENFRAIIGPKTKIVAIPHIPCTTGQVLPIKEICELAKRKGIFSLIDGAHGAGSLPLDLHDIGCDAYASCGHKWMLGPKGTGVLYIRKERLDRIRALHVGAYSDTGWDLLADPPAMKGYVPTAHRYFYGTYNAAQHAGMTEAIRFHEALGKERVSSRIKELSLIVWEGLDAMKDRVHMLTPKEEQSRAGIVAFLPTRKNFAEIATKLRSQNIIIRQVPENNINCLRVSTHIYNSEQEIERFLSAIYELT